MENQTRKIRSVAIAILAPVTLSVTGCVTASSTTALLAQQTQQNRGLLALEQANTRSLTSQRASLQKQLASLTRREQQIKSQGDSADPGELRTIRAEIAKLKQMIANQD
jgi:parvulin-like peptidyl-prolyl isomerase